MKSSSPGSNGHTAEARFLSVRHMLHAINRCVGNFYVHRHQALASAPGAGTGALLHMAVYFVLLYVYTLNKPIKNGLKS